MMNFNKWREYDKKELIAYVYWLRGQLPPSDKHEYEKAWEQIRKDLERMHP